MDTTARAVHGVLVFSQDSFAGNFIALRANMLDSLIETYVKNVDSIIDFWSRWYRIRNVALSWFTCHFSLLVSSLAEHQVMMLHGHLDDCLSSLL